MRTLRLSAAAALALFALAACSEDTPAPSSLPDPGIAACEAAAQSYSSGDDSDIPVAVFAGLKASSNEDLRAAGEALEQLQNLPEDETIEHLEELFDALERFSTGCAAVGVPLPEDMVGSDG